MYLTYHGPHDAVEVDVPAGIALAERDGKPVEIPDEIAKSLLEQGQWKKSAKKPAGKE